MFLAEIFNKMHRQIKSEINKDKIKDDNDERVNQFNNRQLMKNKFFPAMKQTLGLVKFRRIMWQQDGFKPHQAKMMMEWLDTILQDRMLAINCLRRDTPTLRSHSS